MPKRPSDRDPGSATRLSEVRAFLSTRPQELLRTPYEPTALCLASSDVSIGRPLGSFIAAPGPLTAQDVQLEVVQRWSFPFRLVRVGVRLPDDYTSLNAAEVIAAIQSLVGNTSLGAMLGSSG